MTDEVKIIGEETDVDPFNKWVADLTARVTPMVQNIVADRLANDNQFLKKECHCCKAKLLDGATELNVFTGKGYCRYLFCDDCTQKILSMEP